MAAAVELRRAVYIVLLEAHEGWLECEDVGLCREPVVEDDIDIGLARCGYNDKIRVLSAIL